MPGMSEDTWDQELDGQFLESWRQQLMAQAWASLERVEERTGQPLAEILRLRVASPELRSPQLAERLSAQLGRAVSATWVRLNLHRARALFVEALLGEVERTLANPSPERLEEELIELGLLEHCRSGLKRRHRSPAQGSPLVTE